MGTFEEIPFIPLGKKVVKSSIWVFSARITQQIFSFTRIIILARLLSPNDFGLFGIALLTLSALDAFSQTGFKQALIQKKEDIKSYLDAAWTVEVIRGFLIATILFFVAPYVGSFFNAPQAEPILKVIGLSIILHSLTNVAVVYFEKELEFNKHFVYQITGSIVDITVAISAAFLLRSVWALVLGRLARNFTRCIVSYIIDPYRPRFRLDPSQAKELFAFGKWILGSNIVIFFATQGDDFFLTKVLGATALGFYQIAFRLGNMPSSEFTGMIGKVAFPVYSKLQTTPQKLRQAYLRTITFVTFLSIPLTGGIIALASQFTQVFLGDKWLPIIVPLQILAISGMFRSIAGTGGAMFNAIGKPKLDFKMNLVRLLIIILTIYPLTMLWKISGTSLSVLLGIIGACFIWFGASIKETKINSRDYLAAILPPLIGTLFMCGVIISVLNLTIFIGNQLLVFLISVIIGILTYLGVMFLIEKNSSYHGLREVKFILKNLWKS